MALLRHSQLRERGRLQPVLAGTADQGVLAFAAGQQVIACDTMKPVVQVVASHLVGKLVRQSVVSTAADQLVTEHKGQLAIDPKVAQNPLAKADPGLALSNSLSLVAGRGMSAGYRFCLLEDDHIVAVQSCECAHDADALLEADVFLQASNSLAVEVWNGRRRVGILSKPAPKKS